MAETNLTFYRVPKDKNFTVISNFFLEDPDLSGTAKGVLAYILSCDRKIRNDWILYKQELIKHFADGKDSISTALSNLEEKGYLEIRKVKKGKRVQLFFTVWEMPKDFFVRNNSTGIQYENPLQTESCADFQNRMSGISITKGGLCAENPQVLNTYINTTTNYCEESSSSSSSHLNNLRRVMKELNVSVSDDFYSEFKSFAESKGLDEEQSENYIRWIYETKKKTAQNINSFIYKTACRENLLDEYLGEVERKQEAEKKVFCKNCGKEQTFQEIREACCHGCGKDYMDFSQFANTKAINTFRKNKGEAKNCSHNFFNAFQLNTGCQQPYTHEEHNNGSINTITI